MNDFNPNRCTDPVLYHWRVQRTRAKAEARSRRATTILLATSSGFFLCALALALTCRMMGVM